MMITASLCGEWELTFGGESCTGTVPGSVYSFLLAAGRISDPYYRANELDALKLMENSFTFTKRFTPDTALLKCPRVLLHCGGLDTLCRIYLNGDPIGEAYNMHRTWEFELTGLLREGENCLSMEFESPTAAARAAQELDPIGGSRHAMKGFPHIRKAHCMYGWDWGPRLPDAGIWRDIRLLGLDSPRITDFIIRQNHAENGRVWITARLLQDGKARECISLITPDGTPMMMSNGTPFEIKSPKLWWPNGYGEQPLYTVCAELLEDGDVVDSVSKRIGLRTMTVLREKDAWGEGFAQCVNGVRMFAMGADYIPEDNLLSRVTPERTRRLLEQCRAAHFNSVRVWGGGYYPDDFFYDICDELGLVVWQDFMFACANYRLTVEFENNIRAEFEDNIRRIRHHASLGLWCGNNEMEMFQAVGEYGGTPRTRSDYIRMFEHILPETLRKLDPDTFYWPASPSSGGGFDDPNDPDRGDVHYWEVWHGAKPFAEYRKYFFRYASEFGFQSFPCLKTVESFTLPEDRNIFSRVMEMHQRNEGANGKILNYLSQTFQYPKEFRTLLYASQLLQAEAIRYGVEHWRRHRGRCMGAIYWQLNDIWPVASWSSIDYYGRWKALHYAAKRFFAPLLLSCEEIGETSGRLSVTDEPSAVETSVRLCVSNETRSEQPVLVRWALRNSRADILQSGERSVSVPELSSVWLEKQEFPGIDYLSTYFSYELLDVSGNPLSCGTALFTAPKHFEFQDPQLRCSLNGRFLTVSAGCYARGVEISSPDCDLILSDNFFDINGNSVTVEILEGSPETIELCSVYDIR